MFYIGNYWQQKSTVSILKHTQSISIVKSFVMQFGTNYFQKCFRNSLTIYFFSKLVIIAIHNMEVKFVNHEFNSNISCIQDTDC